MLPSEEQTQCEPWDRAGNCRGCEAGQAEPEAFGRIGPVRRKRGQPPTCPADRSAPEWANRVGIYCMLRQFTSNFSTGDLG